MATGRDIINDALLLLGVGAEGEAVSKDTINYGLRAFNRMLSSWSAELGMIYEYSFDDVNWVAGQQSVTIGPSGADITTARPLKITSFQSRNESIDFTVLPITFNLYQTLEQKDITSDYPNVYAYNETFPNGTLFIYPVPSSNLNVRISSEKELTSITLDGNIIFPPGYEQAFQYNLAVMIAPSFGTQASSDIKQEAFNSRQALEINNYDIEEMMPDYQAPGVYNGYNYLRYIKT